MPEVVSLSLGGGYTGVRSVVMRYPTCAVCFTVIDCNGVTGEQWRGTLSPLSQRCAGDSGNSRLRGGCGGGVDPSTTDSGLLCSG